ncbi:hypothetical protein [Paenibacillus methanolicus]|uniref:Sporulation membrane protein YtrI C-terminal domain-containing protein n=1 Tax=Paenibacillus methanolicus TaxID=582686 RepID=A0A5S5BW15_9BACL|nr:hypothetical protein [Paenibacillus methanolicus]TYP71174.1 hypothetical protein BCM02_110124 [Paenibacillus methanolicus]
MRVPPFERYAVLTQGAASFVVGAIVGAIFYHSIFTANFEAVMNANSDMEQQLSQYEVDLKELKQFKNKHSVIKSVLPLQEDTRDSEGEAIVFDELTKAELKKRVRANLNALLGTSIYDIGTNSKIARLLLDDKVFTGIYGNSYTIEIKTMLVSDNVLQVWFQASVLKPSPG